MKSSEQDKLVQRMRETLDGSVDALDEDTARDLQRARIKALQTDSGRSLWWWNTPVFASVIAATFALGIFFTMTTGEFSDQNLPLAEIEETDELYEDLEFYLWLADQESAS